MFDLNLFTEMLPLGKFIATSVKLLKQLYKGYLMGRDLRANSRIKQNFHCWSKQAQNIEFNKDRKNLDLVEIGVSSPEGQRMQNIDG